MHLLKDKKTLVKVDNQDIIDGTFIIPGGVTEIGIHAFANCTALKEITIPDGVTEISVGTFSNCVALMKIVLPGGVTKISRGAFADCHALMEITIPDSVTEIGAGAFFRCFALTQIKLPDGVTEIKSGTFYFCSALTDIAIPAGVNKIGNSALAYCHALKEIAFSNGFTRIGDSAFVGCHALTKITLPEGITKIEQNAFNYCHALTQIIIKTQSDETFNRIKNLLPTEFAHKAVKGPLYREVIAYQQSSYTNHVNPMLGEYRSFYALLIVLFNQRKCCLHTDFIKIIASFDEQCFEAYKQSMNGLNFPRSEEEFKLYKEACKPIFARARRVEDRLAQEANELSSQDTISEAGCKSKLTTYCVYIKELQKIKQNKSPTFFSDNEALSLAIKDKLQAVKKAIDFLAGNGDIAFTLNEMTHLNKGFIGNCLKEYDVSLPLQDDDCSSALVV